MASDSTGDCQNHCFCMLLLAFLVGFVDQLGLGFLATASWNGMLRCTDIASVEPLVFVDWGSFLWVSS